MHAKQQNTVMNMLYDINIKHKLKTRWAIIECMHICDLFEVSIQM